MINNNYHFRFIKNENNIITFEHSETGKVAHVAILEENIIRVFMYQGKPSISKTWLVAPGEKDIPKEGRDRFNLTGFTLPGFQFDKKEGSYEITTPKLRLVLDANSLKARWFAPGESKPFAEDRTTQNINVNGELGDGVFHYMMRNTEDMYFGLGEKAGDTNRYGKSYKMMSVDPMGYDAETTDPLYKHIPFYITKMPRKNAFYGMFYDNLSTSIFDMGKEMDNYHGYYRKYQAESGDLDYYMIYGPPLDSVVKTYTWLTGKTRMMPKWSIGYSGSTMTYTDMDDAQEQLKNFVNDLEKHDIPCDSFQLSSGYTSIGDKRYVFNWNYDRVPTPKEMSQHFHDNGLRLCANIKPALLIDHPQYKDLEKRGLFVKNAEGDKTEIAQFWDELGAYLDFTNPEAFDWWKQQVTGALLEMGIDSTWNDNNEYEIWDSKAKVHGFGEAMTIGDIRPLQPLLMMKASYEAQIEYAPEVRPYLISRSGCPGMQRYVQTWSGDNNTSWKSLKFNIKMGIGLSMSGVYNTGHDVGGFAGRAPEPELLNRWIQNGIFHPRFTIHSWNSDKTVNVPWMYKSDVDSIRDTMKLRIKLTPYLYSLLYKAHDAYEPLLRPTFYNFPDDVETYIENDEFMLGNELLVGSVIEAGAITRTLYLPDNELGWWDFYSRKIYGGGKTITVNAPYEHGALFIRMGSIIPMNSAAISFKTKSADERTLVVYAPKEGNLDGFLYEDDGFTNDYEKGVFKKIILSGSCNGDSVKIYTTVKGSYELPYKTLTIDVPTLGERQLFVNDRVIVRDSKGLFSLTTDTIND
jgi:alpha-glucosidase